MEAHQKEKTIEDELFEALVIENSKSRVMELCGKAEVGPLHKITIHKDTVLHMAVHTEQADLVLELVKALPENEGSRITKAVNDGGNTILHEVAISDKLVGAAEEMLRKAPELLDIKNNYNETALFRAVNFGQIKMFEFLDEKVAKQFTVGKANEFHRTNDSKTKTTTLHVAILAAQFDLANSIVNKHEDLIKEKDYNGMTALQHLSRDEATFNNRGGGFVGHFINSCISSLSTKDNIAGEDSRCWRLPWWEAVRKEDKKYYSALKLAKLLIERDKSWKKTEELRENHVGGEASSDDTLNEEDKKNGENCIGTESSSSSEPLHEDNKKDQKNEDYKRTPLLLATKYGCEEIVKHILDRFPRAIEHVDDKGQTILHIAIKHRQIAIFDMVRKMDIPMKRLVRKCDKRSNSILHMAGQKAKKCKSDDTRSPALQLQKEWQLFERVQNICSAHFFRYINSDNKTAEQLFAETNVTLREKAEQWLKTTAENSSIVAVLIATVAFAAAYTVPGGSDATTGVPILVNKPFFVVFTIADVLSLTFSLTSVIIFLSILTSPFRLIDFKKSLPQKLMLGFTCLIFSVSMMMLAFVATIILVMHNKEQWTKAALYTAALLPVCVFTFSYLPLYSSLSNNRPKKIVMFFSRTTNPCCPASTEATTSSCPSEP